MKKNQFYIIFKNDEFDSFLIKHIQYKIWSLEYNNYRRIDIDIAIEDVIKEDFEITWNDKKTAKILIYCERETVGDLEAKKYIKYIYYLIFKSLQILWKWNEWDPGDLISLYKEIKSDDYNATIPIGKSLRLPYKKGIANIICKLYPQFSEYFFRIENKNNLQNVQFFKGISDIGIFFMFFKVFKIKDNNNFLLSDTNGELNHVFNFSDNEHQRLYVPKINSIETCKKIMQAFESANTKEIFRFMKS